jgi:hypothetical protein
MKKGRETEQQSCCAATRALAGIHDHCWYVDLVQAAPLAEYVTVSGTAKGVWDMYHTYESNLYYFQVLNDNNKMKTFMRMVLQLLLAVPVDSFDIPYLYEHHWPRTLFQSFQWPLSQNFYFIFLAALSLVKL